MRVDFLYFEDCPSYEKALERLGKVMSEAGVGAGIEVTRVETDEQAQKLHFTGSPTIRIDGEDIVPPKENRYGLACRAYQLADGRISPLPSEDMIRQALPPNHPG
ncbi:MAG: hypothetical protein ACFB50_04565 [Rubrobacteraceae bacterium]